MGILHERKKRVPQIRAPNDFLSNKRGDKIHQIHGTCTIRVENFLFRKTMKAICLLWGRWESLADSMLAIPTR